MKDYLQENVFMHTDLILKKNDREPDFLSCDYVADNRRFCEQFKRCVFIRLKKLGKKFIKWKICDMALLYKCMYILLLFCDVYIL